MVLYGWDASDFDWDRGPMDLAAARRDGIDFFTHKATEGTSTKHKRFGEALRRARDAGIPFLGAYGVPRSAGTASAQVDYFLAYVNQQTPWWRDFPGWFWQVDLEHWEYDKVPASRGVEWCTLLRQRTGRQVLLYAPKWAYGNGIGGTDPLWQSAYGTNPAGHYRALYPGDGSSRWGQYSARTPAVLQYGSRTTIGRQTTCDANAFRGTVADFARLIGATQTIPVARGDDMTSTSWTEPLTQGTAGYAGQQRDTALAFAWQAANEAAAGVVRLEAAAAADVVRDNSIYAAIKQLAFATGNDPQPIIDAVNAVRDEARARFAELMTAVHDAEQRAASAEAEVERLRAALHTSAQAEADATADQA